MSLTSCCHGRPEGESKGVQMFPLDLVEHSVKILTFCVAIVAFGLPNKICSPYKNSCAYPCVLLNVFFFMNVDNTSGRKKMSILRGVVRS